MTDVQWQTLIKVLDGETIKPLPIGLLVDSPWLPGWSGNETLDYFSDDRVWLEANIRAAQRFPNVIFLPGFWSEYGMCTEPSAFGSKCVWLENGFPHPGKVLNSMEEIRHLKKPNCRTDGLLPFMLRRLQRCQKEIEAVGHRIRFAVARGPLNIACFLLGPDEVLVGMKVQPEAIHALMEVVTDFLVDWIDLQAKIFDSIDGIFLLDDLIGFLGEEDFLQFVLPYFKRAFTARKFSVRFLHNDAYGMITAKHLSAMDVNLFNFSHTHKMTEVRQAAGPTVSLVGNIPPRDVLGLGTPDDVRRATKQLLDSLTDKRRTVVSCGGGVPPGTTTENIEALIETVAASH